LAQDAATVEEIMMSTLDWFGDLSSFGYEVHSRIQELTFSTGYEYRATLGSKSVLDWIGREGTVFCATISTSHSPVLSAPAMLAPSGFSYISGLVMHSHSPFLSGYRLTRMDTLYLEESGLNFSAGTRLDSRMARSLTNSVRFSNPSRQDLRAPVGGFLSSPNGLIPYGH
jgi:hypothetical protein